MPSTTLHRAASVSPPHRTARSLRVTHCQLLPDSVSANINLIGPHACYDECKRCALARGLVGGSIMLSCASRRSSTRTGPRMLPNDELVASPYSTKTHIWSG